MMQILQPHPPAAPPTTASMSAVGLAAEAVGAALHINNHSGDGDDNDATTTMTASSITNNNIMNNNINGGRCNGTSYVESCGVMGVRPNKVLLQQLSSPGLSILQLAGTYVGRQGIIALCSVFGQMPSLRWLGLSQNHLDNETCAVVCNTLHLLKSLQVVDLSNNEKITRVGGHRLLSVVSKLNDLVHMNVSETNVTAYYVRRIRGHAQRHFQALGFDAVYSLSVLASKAQCMKQASLFPHRNSVTPHSLPSTPLPTISAFDMDGDGATLDDDEIIFARALVELCGIQISHLRNEAHDEAWTLPPESEIIQFPQVLTTPTPNILQYNTSANFDVTTATPSAAPFCIEHDTLHQHILLRHTTPMSFLPGGAAVPEDLDTLLQAVVAFKPKTVVLPTMFRFPGNIDMMPAVHAPDPMLNPPAPFNVPMSSRREMVSPVAGESMFFAFFSNTQQQQRQQQGGSTAEPPTTATEPVVGETPLVSTSMIEEETLPAAVQAPAPPPSAAVKKAPPRPGTGLRRVSDQRLSCAVYHQRADKITSASSDVPSTDTRDGIHKLLTDPTWSPEQTGASSAALTQYLTQRRLMYNTVSLEKTCRRHLSLPPRYNLEHVVRHSKTERLTNGCLNHDGRLLATSSYDMTCKVWNLDTGKLHHVLRGHEGYVYDVVWSAPQCDRIVTASFDKTCKVWDPQSGECLHTLIGHELEVVCVAVNTVVRRVASGGMDEVVILWDLDTGQELFNLTGHQAEVVCVDMSVTGTYVVSGSMDETVRLWDTATGASLGVFTSNSELCAVKINRHNNLVLAGCADGTCRLWDINTRACKVLRGHTRDVVDCDFSSDGWLVASASEDGTARVWDVLTGGCLAMMVGHDAGVYRVAFSNDGTELLTGSADKTARLWRVENSQCLQVLRGHKGVVLASYSGDNKTVLTLSKDNTCRVWRRECVPEPTLLSTLCGFVCHMPQEAISAVLSGLHDGLRDTVTATQRALQLDKQRREGTQSRRTPTPSLSVVVEGSSSEDDDNGDDGNISSPTEPNHADGDDDDDDADEGEDTDGDDNVVDQGTNM
eukprot:PhM_4_TR9231/c0_g1_i1/m.19066/K19760/DAW1; dynein assembly factor with WDR repeat domains 1